MDPLDAIFEYIDAQEGTFIEELGKSVAIPSVSAWKNQRTYYNHILAMIEFTKTKLRDLNFNVETRPLDPCYRIRMDNGDQEPLPSVILATLGSDPDKHTLLIYGHLDVQPAKLSDGWNSDPWTLTQREGNLYGRGSTDDKGPVLGWLHALEAFKFCAIEVPINIKIILDSDEEDGSRGLEEALRKEKDGFFADVDFVVISDNYWVGREVPCLTYGLRGLVKFDMAVTGGSKDLHSGVHGGAIHEPMDDLIWMLSQLKDGRNGKILIPGVQKGMTPIERGDRQQYSELDFNLQNYRQEVGCPALMYPKGKEDTLMARWRLPCLSIHGIEGAFSDPGFKTVIPCRVVGKFSIRLVPDQNPAEVEKAVVTHLNARWKARGSRNNFKVTPGVPAGRPWLGGRPNRNYICAALAIERVWGRWPQGIREGGSIPITLVLFELAEAHTVLLPMGQSDDGAHSQNEKISIRNYIQGTKVFAAYIMQLEHPPIVEPPPPRRRR